jgi:hypothetical protein
MTSFQPIYDMFWNKINNRRDFFIYNGLDETATKALIKERTIDFLKLAISDLTSLGELDIDLNSYDETLEQFPIDLVYSELDIISDLMEKRLLNQDIEKLKVFQPFFNPKELNAFAPANERNSYNNMLKEFNSNLTRKIKNYLNRDRKTGKLKMPKSTISAITDSEES